MEYFKTYQEVLSMEPNELQTWLEGFNVTLPTEIETIEDMQDAARKLSILGSNFAYVNSLSVYAKNAVRVEKRKGKDNKETYEDMIDRENAIHSSADNIKMLYNCLSRLITIKQEINKEINISNPYNK